VILSGTVGTGGYYTSPVILGILGGAALEAKIVYNPGGGACPGTGCERIEDYTTPVTIAADANVEIRVGNDTLPITVKVDQTAPTVSAIFPGTGVYQIGDIVSVSCTFSDEGSSGLVTRSCGAPGPGPTTLDTSTLGDKTFVVSATDGAGNVSTRTYTYSVRDLTKPVITSVSPLPTGTYDLGQLVNITCSFSDSGGSLLATVRCGSATATNVGANQKSITTALDTTTPGPKTFVVSATDGAGNSTSTSYSYTVRDYYTCDPAGDGVTTAGDIVGCAAKINGDGTATLSVLVAGTIDTTGTQYRLLLATAPNQSGTLVKWSAGSISGKPLMSAGVSTSNPSRLDFKVSLASVGVPAGGTLYWAAQTQSGEKAKPSAGFLDTAPNSGYFQLRT
jgi:hypothetical protein